MPFDREGQRGGEREPPGRPAIPSAAPPLLPRSGHAGKPRRAKADARTRTAETTPSPGIRTVAQQTALSSASPTAGASHDHRRPPQRRIAACPIASEAAQIASTAT